MCVTKMSYICSILIDSMSQMAEWLSGKNLGCRFEVAGSNPAFCTFFFQCAVDNLGIANFCNTYL